MKILNEFALPMFLIGILAFLMAFGPEPPSQYPFGFIPLKEKVNPSQTAVLNANKIILIEPIFDPQIPINKRKEKHILYLELTLSNSTKLKLEEDLDGLLNRILNSQSR